MSSVDQRVVEAKFDNKQFQEGVRSTISSLDQLKRGLNLDGATNGLNNVAQATGRVAHGFSTMRIVAFTVISTITRQLLYMAEHVVAAFTIDPIKEGFQNYETQINAVQTILANTGLKGKEGLQKVTDVLQQLNVYANQTVYNFSEMARNIGTFTAAGVKLQPAADAIKGIANLAAMSGSSSAQASTAMYQLSQAIAANQVKLQDWNSVVNAGMGGKVFQKALFDTAVAMQTIKHVKLGTTFDEWTKSGHTFRSSLQDGWVTGKVLTSTLQQFTGDMTKAQLKQIGFNAKQIKAIQEQGKVAVDAATKIKTFSQLGQALKEEVGTAYASIFKTLFGDINQAKSALSPLHVTLENFLTGPVYSLNKVFEGWAKLGGRTAAIQAFKLAWRDMGEVLKPISNAFHEVFHSTYGMDVTFAKITFAIRDFFKNFKMGADTSHELKRTFAGLFAIFDIGWQVIKQVAHFLGDLLGKAGHGSGGILKFTASIGDLIVKLDNAIKHGKGLRNFFVSLEDAIKPVIDFLHKLTGKLGDLGGHTGNAASKVTHALSRIGDFLKHLAGDVTTALGDMFKNINWNTIMGFMGVGMVAAIGLLIKRIADRFKPKEKGDGPFKQLINAIREPFEELTSTLQQMQKTLQAATLLEIAIAVGILAASVIALSKVNAANLGKALAGIGGMFAELLGATAVFSKIGGAKGLVSTGAGLVVFATAIRILTSAVVKLSGVSWEGLAKGLITTTALIAGLVLASRGMSGQGSGMIRTSLGLLAMATSIRILAGAVKDFAKMSWTEIAKGLVGVDTLLASLALFTRFSGGKTGVLQGAGLLLLAAGIEVLALAVGRFAKLSWTGIAKGLASITAILLEFTIFSKTVGNPIKLVLASAALVAIGVAMNELAAAMLIFGHQSWTGIAKGLVAMGGALAIIAVAMDAMPITSVLSATALVAVGVALNTIALSMKLMGTMSWGAIAKSLVELGGSLLIIAVGMDAMLTALPGAAALVVVAAAIALLVPELMALGQMSWMSILKSLVALAGALTVLGLTAALLTEAIPSMLGLGAAILLIGAGIGVAGAGIFLLGAGLTSIAAAGSAAGAAIVSLADGIIGLIPAIAEAAAKAVGAFAEQFSKEGPKVVDALITIFDSLLTAARREIPRLVNTFVHLTEMILTKLDDHLPKIVNKFSKLLVDTMNAIKHHSGRVINAFTDMVDAILRHMAQHAGDFVSAAVSWIVAVINGIDQSDQKIINAATRTAIHFINGMSKAGVKIANAGVQAIIDFINGVADAITNHQTELNDAGKNLASAIVSGLSGGLSSKIGEIKDKSIGLVEGGFNAAKGWLGIHSPSRRYMQLGHWIGQGLAKGLDGSRQGVIDAWNRTRDMLKSAIDETKQDISDYTQKLKDAEKAHNTKKIAEYTAKLKELHLELPRLQGALQKLNDERKTEEAHLERLGKKYDIYTAKLDKANQKLANHKQALKDYNNQVKQQYDVLPDISTDTTLSAYEKQGRQSVRDLETFTEVLHKLRSRGLSNLMYRELLSKGTAALPMAEEILAGGQTAISKVNDIASDMHKEAKALGSTASRQLYQAGVDSAQGLVDGLKKKRNDIAKEMRGIAHDLVKELRKELKIKSPSEVFDELGRYTGLGLANGLRKSVPEVQRATSHLGRNTIESMKKSIAAMNDLIANQTDLQPTIRPVLDLSTMKRQAAGIHDALASKRLLIGSAYSAAVNASAGYEANQLPTNPTDAISAPTEVTFIQNNNSPRALSSADIYRQTNNQLSRAKGALNPSAA